VIGEERVLAAMRAWRAGCGALLPWFRATPFAAAHHYRERLPIARPGRMPSATARAVRALPPPRRATLWIFDVPGPEALWLACGLRRRFRLGAALCFNGWYDPRGVLDGRAEIPLLLGLAKRLAPPRRSAPACLIFDADRQREVVGRPEALFDNRYTLGDEDAPSLDQVRAAGWREVRAHAWREPAKDLLAYLEYLDRELPVSIERELGLAHRG
jgi:hypothetical protein